MFRHYGILNINKILKMYIEIYLKNRASKNEYILWKYSILKVTGFILLQSDDLTHVFLDYKTQIKATENWLIFYI